MITITKHKKGFALLMAVLISSVLLAIGLAILSITYKELILSSTIRNSHRAFYAADTGLECANLWNEEDKFATSSRSQLILGLMCGDYDISGASTGDTSDDWNVTRDATSAETIFTVTSNSNDICANVRVLKTSTSTIIESRGYNTCITSDPKRVERGLRMILF